MIVDVVPRAAPVNFAPATEVEEILQNVATILATARYSVPYDRAFGLNPEYLDDPMPLTQARATADIIATIKRYEPRCKIESVTFTGDAASGTMKPVVRVYING